MLAVLAQSDPTGLSSTAGRILVGLALLAAIVVLIRQFRSRR